MEDLTPSLRSRAVYFAANNASPGKLPPYDLRDLDVLRDIIHRATLSPDGDSFLSVFRAYDSVLKERAIDPSQDRLYFKILLKLARIKGGSWYEKLQLVLGTLGVTEEDITATVISQQTPVSPLRHHKARRVLFKDHINSASRTSQVGDNPFPTPPNSSALSSSKSAPSLLPDLNLPLLRYYLSSWRLKATSRLQRHRQQDAFAIEWDHRALLTEAFLGWREKTKSFCQLQKRASKAYSIIILEKSLAKWRSQYSRKNQQHHDFADYFNSICLLKSCLEKWRYRIQNDTRKGNGFLLDRMVQKWKFKYSRITKMESQAQHFSKHRRLALSWREWFFKTCQSRAAVYYNLKLAGRVVTLWMNLTRETKTLAVRAEKTHHSKVLRKLLSMWISKLRKFNNMNIQACRCFDSKILRFAFENWKRDSKLQKMAVAHLQKIDVKLMQDCLGIWFWRFQEIEHVNDFYRKALLSRCLVTWHRQVKLKQATREVECHVTFRSFHFWITQERAILLGRVLDCRLLNDALTIWRDKYQTIRDTLGVVEKTVILNTEFRVQKKAFKNWKHKLWKIIDEESIANKMYQTSILLNAMSLWKLEIQTVRKLELKAEKESRVFLLRNTLMNWRRARQQSVKRRKEAQKLLAKEYYDRQVKVFTVELWVSRVSKIRYMEAQANVAKSHFEASITRMVFSEWRTICQTLQGFGQVAEEIYDKKILGSSFSTWVDSFYFCKEMAAMASKVYSAKIYDHQVNCLRTWRRRMFRVKGLHYQAFLMIRQCEGRLMRLLFRIWIRKLREKHGKHQESIQVQTPTRPFRSWKLGRNR